MASMNKYESVAAVLAEAKDKINNLLSDPFDEHHRIKLEHSLIRDIDYINLISGSGDVFTKERKKPGPAKTMAGQKLTFPQKQKTNPEDLFPPQEKVSALKQEVEAAWSVFLEHDSKDILKNFKEIVIRGVAKKAQMRVTKDSPSKLSVKFIDSVKDEIKLIQEREAATKQDPPVKTEVDIDEITGENENQN